MTDYNELSGDLIDLAKKGTFDVVAHGCNCFCIMGAGIAPQMASAFGCNYFPLESQKHSGVESKLGKIDYKTLNINGKELTVVNAYTQYGLSGKPFSYEAFEKIVSEMNKTFAGKHIGLPKIGAGLAGGDWKIIKSMIIDGFKDCKVTVINYKKTRL